MAHLTLQEVIERIKKNASLTNDHRTQRTRTDEEPHRPEFYVPRIARRLAEFRFSGFAK